MSVHRSLHGFVAVALMITFLLVPPRVSAERFTKVSGSAEAVRQVGLFEAMDRGQVEVRFIPKDASEANVLIENKTDQPLSIKFPETFGAVHVLAQPGFGDLGAGGAGGRGLGGGVGQGLGGGGGNLGGGGFGGGGGGFGGGGLGGGGGFFNVAPHKVTKVKVPCVCLEHGKPDPNPRMTYKMIPIESLTQDPKVIEVCKMLGYGKVAQNAAQAAAWNLANGLSWSELANMNRVERKTIGYAERFFSSQDLRLATRLVEEATSRTKNARADARSPGEATATPQLTAGDNQQEGG